MPNQTFTFGKNWQEYIEKQVNSVRIAEAKKSLTQFLEVKNLNRKTFLDIGCGSGLFSLAAYYLGAKRIVSFDYDKESVACTKQLHRFAGEPKNWTVLLGSILDLSFVKSLGKFDYIYAWGVLHHTGNMWKALSNTCLIPKKKGYMYLAIYNKAEDFCIYKDGRVGSSAFWRKIKKKYVYSPKIISDLINYAVMSFLFLSYLVRLQNPFSKISQHAKLRGMSWSIDIKDWLGGYPYEYASIDEIFQTVKKRGFVLENLKCQSGLRNNEYLFQKV